MPSRRPRGRQGLATPMSSGEGEEGTRVLYGEEVSGGGEEMGGWRRARRALEGGG